MSAVFHYWISFYCINIILEALPHSGTSVYHTLNVRALLFKIGWTSSLRSLLMHPRQSEDYCLAVSPQPPLPPPPPVKTERRSKDKAGVWVRMASIFVLLHKRWHIFKVEKVKVVKLMTSSIESYFPTWRWIAVVGFLFFSTSRDVSHQKFSIIFNVVF